MRTDTLLTSISGSTYIYYDVNLSCRLFTYRGSMIHIYTQIFKRDEEVWTEIDVITIGKDCTHSYVQDRIDEYIGDYEDVE